MQNVIALCLINAVFLAGCSTSQAVSASADKQVSTVRAVIGTSIVGAIGQTPRDQRKIDDTVAGACGAGALTKAECDRHSRETQGS